MTRMTEYTVVSRSARINATPEEIVPLLADLHRWREWSPWEDLDPELQRRYDGPESGVGAGYEWSGNRKAGAGRMQITGVTPGSVDLDVTFTKPFKSESRSAFRLTAVGDETDVTWQMMTPKSLVTRIMGIFVSMDKMIGPDLEKGLTQLNRAVAV